MQSTIMLSKRARLSIVTAFLLCFATFASANVDVTAGGAAWQAQKADSVLSVSGPDGTFSLDFAAGETPYLNVADLTDGTYTWELRFNAPTRNRAAAVGHVAQAPLHGTLSVLGGSFVDPTLVESVDKAQTFTTDLIVQGSACVGIDCTSSESFGFDTLRLKENNLRIKFDDTSGSASFPNNDWQLTANESGNGGLNKFSIDDITGGKTPFTIEAGAPTTALYVDDAGNVGLDTSNPVVELHIQDGDSPTVRLEQDGSAGFGSQTWDLAGNETNFFVRDVTNGSKLPFKIIPNAPTNSLYVAADGDVGINNANPSTKLHVKGGDATVEGPSAKLNITDSTNSVNWFFQADSASDALLISKSGSGGGEIRIDDRQDGGSSGVTLFVDGSVSATNVTFTSSRAKKADFESVDPQDVLTRLNGIDIQTWRYKSEDSDIRHMGPIAEDFAAAFGLGASDTKITVTDVNGVALAAIQALSQELENLKAHNQALEDQNNDLADRLSELEGR